MAVSSTKGVSDRCSFERVLHMHLPKEEQKGCLLF